MQKLSLVNVQAYYLDDVAKAAFKLRGIYVQSYVLEDLDYKNPRVNTASKVLSSILFEEIVIRGIKDMRSVVVELENMPKQMQRMRLTDDLRNKELIDDSYMPKGFKRTQVNELYLEVLFEENAAIMLDYVRPTPKTGSLSVKFLKKEHVNVDYLLEQISSKKLWPMTRVYFDVDQATPYDLEKMQSVKNAKQAFIRTRRLIINSVE